MEFMTAKQRKAYAMGVAARAMGKPDINPFGLGDLQERSAWSAGYFDKKRGMV